MAPSSGMLAVFTALGLFAGCAAVQPAVSTSRPVARQAWRYALPAGWNYQRVRVGDDAVVLGSESEIRVLDAASGRLRWRRDGGASGMVVGRDVVYGSTGGALVSRGLRDGRLRWKRAGVCSVPAYAKAYPNPAIVVRNGGDVIAGCSGGALARVSADSGAVRARSGDAFVVDGIGSIMPLGRCALSVTGWTDGAHLQSHSAVLDCERLRAIVRQGQDLSVLGAIGNVAVLDDVCCNGRAGVYQPATIVLANLATGALSPPVDLTPEPDRYPANQRPVGQGSAAKLDGNELYLAVDRTVYRYGDPRALAAIPQRVPGELVDFPVLLAHGLLALRARTGGGVEDQIVRIRNGAFEALWRKPETGSIIFGYDPNDAPDVLRILRTDEDGGGTTLVRTYDGAELNVTDPCQLAAANKYLVVTICNTQTLVGNRYLQYVAGYRWPDAPRPRSSG